MKRRLVPLPHPEGSNAEQPQNNAADPVFPPTIDCQKPAKRLNNILILKLTQSLTTIKNRIL
jgi:hypothetical protein